MDEKLPVILAEGAAALGRGVWLEREIPEGWQVGCRYTSNPTVAGWVIIRPSDPADLRAAKWDNLRLSFQAFFEDNL